MVLLLFVAGRGIFGGGTSDQQLEVGVGSVGGANEGTVSDMGTH